MCMNQGLSDFCGVTCDTDSDCPSGFICIDWQDSNDEYLALVCHLLLALHSRHPNVLGDPLLDAPECVQEQNNGQFVF